MAFTAGIKRPQQNTNTSNSNEQNTYDRLITVTSYDTNKGYMYGTDDKGKKYEIYVNPKEFQRAEDSVLSRKIDVGKVNWMGHKIDKGMEKSVPVGSKVVLIRSKVVTNDKTREMSVTEVHRIGGVPNPDTDKTFQGIFTMTYRMDEGKKRISRVQHWNPRAVNVNVESDVAALATKIDEARKNYGVKLGEHNVTEPTIGVQFRALLKTDRAYPYLDNRPVFEVVDSSLPFDWIPGPEDENGKEIKTQAHPLTGDEMLSYAEAYAEYISNHEQFQESLENMRVEICYYHVYPASRNDTLLLTTGDKDKDRNADKNPLYQLSHRVSYVDMANNDDALIVGRNAAVNGIIQIAGNKLEKVNGKPVEIANYWVNKVYANNTRGHVHSFVRSVDEEGLEYKAEPHEKLKLIKTEQQEQAGRGEAAPASQPTPAPVAAKSSAVSVEKEFNPFEEAGSGDFNPFVESSGDKKPLFGAKKAAE